MSRERMSAGNWRPADFVLRSWSVDRMSWRVGLIDSCGSWPGAIDAAAFVVDGERVERRATAADPSGHGTRIAQLFAAGDAAFELLLGQVFLDAGPASGAAVAAAVDWAIAGRADLIHMSLGLAADRAVLAASVARAVESGCIIVASTPARGTEVYPAAYPQVIRATGDARCAPGELSCLAPGFFGACPRFAAGGPADSGAGVRGGGSQGDASYARSDARSAHTDRRDVRSADDVRGGASVAAGWVTRNILTRPTPMTASAAVAALTTSARYMGPERRGVR
jgi:hypothetical protein